jgi:hypothetical protein
MNCSCQKLCSVRMTFLDQVYNHERFGVCVLENDGLGDLVYNETTKRSDFIDISNMRPPKMMLLITYFE